MKLYLDDIREPPENQNYKVARSTQEAIELVKNEWPTFMSLDHDLGEEDTTMKFLNRIVNEVWDITKPVPDYVVHSANPVGKLNIISFMESWKRSTIL